MNNFFCILLLVSIGITAMDRKEHGDKQVELKNLHQLLQQKKLKNDLWVNLESEGLTSLEGISSVGFSKSKTFLKDRIKLLFVSNNFLKNLPEEIGEFELLSTIHANCNSIENVSFQLIKLTNLENLRLNSNRIRELSFPFEFKNLKELFLQDNVLERLPTLSKCTHLKNLDISNNKLLQLTDEEGNFVLPTSLVSLRASSNQISKLPQEMSQLGALMYINFSHNHLKTIAINWEKFTQLCNLDFSYCGIAELPESISRITFDNPYNDFSIDLSGNKLVSMPAAFDIPVTFKMRLDKNSFTRIGKTLCARLHSLTHLSLKSNPIIKVSSAIKSLTRLVYLDLSNCELEKIPDTVYLCPLGTLRLNNNRLKNLPQSITKLTTLQSLQVLDNHRDLLRFIFDNKNNKTLFTFVQSLRKQKKVQYGNPLRKLPNDIKREIYQHLD